MDYVLANVEERERGNRETFVIPGMKFRHALRVGDLAKLVFVRAEPPAGERMWVEITVVHHANSPTERTRYTGVLRNHPGDIDAKYGDEVHFGPEHVADFERPARTD